MLSSAYLVSFYFLSLLAQIYDFRIYSFRFCLAHSPTARDTRSKQSGSTAITHCSNKASDPQNVIGMPNPIHQGTHSPTRSTQAQASSTTIYLLPFCSQKYSFFFSVPSYRTNSIHFLGMFLQGAGDVCVILKLSKLFLFLVFFSQFLHTQFARMVAHCSYCGVSAALRVFFSRVLDSGIFWGVTPVFSLRHYFSHLYWTPVTPSDLVTHKIFPSFLKPCLAALILRHISFSLPYLSILAFKYLIFNYLPVVLSTATHLLKKSLLYHSLIIFSSIILFFPLLPFW